MNRVLLCISYPDKILALFKPFVERLAAFISENVVENYGIKIQFTTGGFILAFSSRTASHEIHTHVRNLVGNLLQSFNHLVKTAIGLENPSGFDMPSPIKYTVAEVDRVMTAVKELAHQILERLGNDLCICGKQLPFETIFLQIAVKALYSLFSLVPIIHVKKKAGSAIGVLGIGWRNFLSRGKFPGIVGIRIRIHPNLRIDYLSVDGRVSGEIVPLFLQIVKIAAVI